MAVAPFHMWAPDVYEGAPTPVVGLISVLPKAAIVVVVLRLSASSFNSQPFWKPVIGIMAGMTMTIGNVWALRQTNIKRMLAYSSIAQLGYVLAGIAISVSRPEAAQAALFYLLTYLFMNLGAFFVATRVNRTNVNHLFARGVGDASPS